MTLEECSFLATIIGTAVGASALVFTAIEVRGATAIARAEFHLELEKLFSEHDNVHLKLRPGGLWARPNSGPDSAEEWTEVEDYMGLFEHAEIMLQKKLVDWTTFRTIFGYRVKNILLNKRISETKLGKESASWEVFIQHVVRYNDPRLTQLLPRTS